MAEGDQPKPAPQSDAQAPEAAPKQEAPPKPNAENHVIALQPLPPLLSRVLPKFESDDANAIYKVASVAEAVQAVKQFAPCLIFLSAYSRDEIVKATQFFKEAQALVKGQMIKAVVISKLEDPRIIQSFQKLGCSDYLLDDLSDYSFSYKINLYLKALRSKRKQVKELTLKKSGGGDASASSVKGSRVSGETKDAACLEIGEDFWLIKGNKPKRMGRQWVLDMEGPDPESGEWVLLDGPAGQKKWGFKMKPPSEFANDPKTDGWEFNGQKPVYVEATGTWKFIGPEPDLSFKKEGKKAASKVSIDEKGDFNIALDSETAKKNIKKSKDDIAAAHAKKAKELSAKDPKGEALEKLEIKKAEAKAEEEKAAAKPGSKAKAGANGQPLDDAGLEDGAGAAEADSDKSPEMKKTTGASAAAAKKGPQLKGATALEAEEAQDGVSDSSPGKPGEAKNAPARAALKLKDQAAALQPEFSDQTGEGDENLPPEIRSKLKKEAEREGIRNKLDPSGKKLAKKGGQVGEEADVLELAELDAEGDDGQDDGSPQSSRKSATTKTAAEKKKKALAKAPGQAALSDEDGDGSDEMGGLDLGGSNDREIQNKLTPEERKRAREISKKGLEPRGETAEELGLDREVEEERAERGQEKEKGHGWGPKLKLEDEKKENGALSLGGERGPSFQGGKVPGPDTTFKPATTSFGEQERKMGYRPKMLDLDKDKPVPQGSDDKEKARAEKKKKADKRSKAIGPQGFEPDSDAANGSGQKDEKKSLKKLLEERKERRKKQLEKEKKGAKSGKDGHFDAEALEDEKSREALSPEKRKEAEAKKLEKKAAAKKAKTFKDAKGKGLDESATFEGDDDKEALSVEGGRGKKGEFQGEESEASAGDRPAPPPSIFVFLLGLADKINRNGDTAPLYGWILEELRLDRGSAEALLLEATGSQGKLMAKAGAVGPALGDTIELSQLTATGGSLEKLGQTGYSLVLRGKGETSNGGKFSARITQELVRILGLRALKIRKTA